MGAVLPLALVYGAAAVSRRMGSGSDTLRDVILRYAYAVVPLGFAVWLAHYLFHFLTGMMTLVSALQTFAAADTLGTDLLALPTGRWRRFVPPAGHPGHADRRHVDRRQRGIGHGSGARCAEGDMPDARHSHGWKF
ncbi:MAG: hypothetical protein R2854_08830 [Caldilineaceae bacterium]